MIVNVTTRDFTNLMLLMTSGVVVCTLEVVITDHGGHVDHLA